MKRINFQCVNLCRPTIFSISLLQLQKLEQIIGGGFSVAKYSFLSFDVPLHALSNIAVCNNKATKRAIGYIAFYQLNCGTLYGFFKEKCLVTTQSVLTIISGLKGLDDTVIENLSLHSVS